MNLEYFIARRSERESKSQEPSIMMRVATIAVALGIVVMIITIAVIAGFKSHISDKLSGISGDLVVTHVRGVDSALPVRKVEGLVDGSLRESTYILRGAIVRGGGLLDGVVVKGVDSHYNTPFFGEALQEGKLPQFGGDESRREVLISEALASDMKLSTGERIELLFTEQSGEVDRLTFKIAGIFSAGVGDIEKRVVIADIETMRKINGWEEDQISGCEIWIDDINQATKVAERLNERFIFEDRELFDQMAAFSVEELYPSLFDWLKTHDINGVVVVSIMMIVALFNMVTALLILVLERTRMVGILKSLGMGNDSLQRIFLYRALGVSIRGLAWGNAIALVVCAAQSHWGILKLEASGYVLSVVPISLGAWWIIALNLGVVGVILLVMIIPTRIVATIKPDEIVKYK